MLATFSWKNWVTDMAKNTITLSFTSDAPLTDQEQEALLVQIELAVCEPVIFGDGGGPEDADWSATDVNIDGEFGLV